MPKKKYCNTNPCNFVFYLILCFYCIKLLKDYRINTFFFSLKSYSFSVAILFIHVVVMSMRKHQWILTLDEPTFSYSSPAIGLKRVLTAVQYSTTARETPALPTIGCDELSGPEAVVTLHPAEHRRLPGIRTTLILYPETELSQQPATFVNVCAAKFQRLYILQPSAKSTLVL